MGASSVHTGSTLAEARPGAAKAGHSLANNRRYSAENYERMVDFQPALDRSQVNVCGCQLSFSRQQPKPKPAIQTLLEFRYTLVAAGPALAEANPSSAETNPSVVEMGFGHHAAKAARNCVGFAQMKTGIPIFNQLPQNQGFFFAKIGLASTNSRLFSAKLAICLSAFGLASLGSGPKLRKGFGLVIVGRCQT